MKTELIITIISLIHFIIFFGAFSAIIPQSRTKSQDPKEIERVNTNFRIFKESLPFIKNYSYFAYIINLFYPFIYLYFSKIDIIYSEISIKTIISIFAFIISLIFFLYKKMVIDEYSNLDKSKKERFPNLGVYLLFYIYATSVNSSLIFVHLTNFALDFSKGEERIVTVTDTRHRVSTSRNGSTHYYEIYYEPDIKSKYKIEVPKSFMEKAKKGDKLKLYLKNGVFGLPYISSDRQIIE